MFASTHVAAPSDICLCGCSWRTVDSPEMLLVCKLLSLSPPNCCTFYRNSTQTLTYSIVIQAHNSMLCTSKFQGADFHSEFIVENSSSQKSNLLKASFNIKHCTAGFWSATSNICFSASVNLCCG